MFQLVVLIALALSLSSSVAAQVIQAPPRQMQEARTPRTRATNDATLTFNLLGGYDESLDPTSQGGAPSIGSNPALLAPRPSGFLGLADSGLTYGRQSARRSFDVRGRGYMNAYQHSGTGATYGGEVTTSAATEIGRRNRLSVNQNYQNAPFYSVGLLGTVGGVGGNPTLAFTNGRTWTAGAGAGLTREWSRTTQTTLSYSYSRRGYTGVSTGGTAQGSVGPFHDHSHNGTFDLTRSIGRRVSVHSLLRHSITESIQSGGGFRPVTHDDVEAGLSYTRDLSRSRRLTIAGGGGTARVDSSSYLTSTPIHYWTPLFYGSAGFDIGRSWSLTSAYRRTVSVPSVLNTTQDAFVTHNLTIGLGGELAERIELALSGAFTNGQTGSAAVGTSPATYHAYTGTGQLTFRMTSAWSAMVNLGHVETQMNEAASQILGTVRDLSRTQVRAGLSWQMPLAGGQRRPRN